MNQIYTIEAMIGAVRAATVEVIADSSLGAISRAVRELNRATPQGDAFDINKIIILKVRGLEDRDEGYAGSLRWE